MAFFDRFMGKKDGQKNAVAASSKPHATVAASADVLAGAGPTPVASKIRQTIAIASGKGGVGKSTVTANLAFALSRAGARVGVLDADIYGPSQPIMLGAAGITTGAQTDEQNQLIPFEKNGVKLMSMSLLMQKDAPVVWRAPMAMKLLHQFINGVAWGELDYLLIDLPPGTGDVQLTLAQQARLNGTIIVTTPQQVALGIAARGLKMFQQVNVPILGIIENMSGFSCAHCGNETEIFKKGGGAELAKQMSVPYIGAIPLDPAVMMSADIGTPLTEAAPDSHAARAFADLASRLESMIISMSPDAMKIEPAEAKIEGDGLVLAVTWTDGKKSTHAARALRIQCGCANCVDENTGKRTLDPAAIAEDIRLEGMGAVGRYAFGLKFSDGHSTGIYMFEKLREWGGLSNKKSEAAATDAAMKLQVQKILEEELNPSLASHDGSAEVIEVKDGRVSLKMNGGCQGCGGAQMTLRQGIEKVLKAKVPGVREVVDVTDHASGTKPFMPRSPDAPTL